MKMLFSILLLACTALAVASDQSNLNDALQKQYQKRVLVPRSPFQPGDQEFDSAGKPLKNPSKSPWLAYGPLLITKISSDSDRLLLEGVRVDSPHLDKPDKNHLLASGKKVAFRIHLDHQLGSLDEATAILDRVFFLEINHSDYSTPEYRRPNEKIAANETIYHVGSGVTGPQAVFVSDPDYSDKARKAKYQGTVILGVVVDPTGEVSRIKIWRPLGMGLDEEAVATVRTWKFKPGMHNGKPVPVEVSVEVSFNLY